MGRGSKGKKKHNPFAVFERLSATKSLISRLSDLKKQAIILMDQINKLRTEKEELENAIQKPCAKGVDVCEHAKDGETLAEGNIEGSKVTS